MRRTRANLWKSCTRTTCGRCRINPLRTFGALALSLAAFAVIGCRQDMHDQPKYIPLRPSTFFADGRSARPLVENTVARGHLNEDTVYYTGRDAAGKLATEFPIPVTKELVLRGQDRFNVYCTPCHDRGGTGN